MNYLSVIPGNGHEETTAQMFWRHLLDVRLERLGREGWSFNIPYVYKHVLTLDFITPEKAQGSISFSGNEELVRQLDQYEWNPVIWQRLQQKKEQRKDWNSVIQRHGNSVVFDIAKYKQAQKEGRLP